MHDVQPFRPALAASTHALLQQSTAAKSAVSVLDEENGMTEEPVYDEMDLNRGSITVYIGDDGKQYAKQGENDPQKRDNLQITTDGGRTDNTLTIEGGTTGAKVTLSNVNINAPDAAVSVSGNVELIITGTNILRSGKNHAGVEKADDNGTLTISGSGTLERLRRSRAVQALAVVPRKAAAILRSKAASSTPMAVNGVQALAEVAQRATVRV